MTRESKVGLVVAGSFVCLLGIVIASKMRRADAPTGAEESAAVEGKGNDPKKKAPPASAAPGPFALAPTKDAIKPVAAAEPPPPNPFQKPKKEEGPGGGFQPPVLPPGGGLGDPPPARLGNSDDDHVKKQLERAQNSMRTPPGAPAPTPDSPLPPLNIPNGRPGAGDPRLAQAAKDPLPALGGLPPANPAPAPPPVKGGPAEEKAPPPLGGLPPLQEKKTPAEEKAPSPNFGGTGLPDLNKKGPEEKKGSIAPPPGLPETQKADEKKSGALAPPPPVGLPDVKGPPEKKENVPLPGLPENKGVAPPPAGLPDVKGPPEKKGTALPGLPERKAPDPIGAPPPTGGTLKDIPPSIGTPPEPTPAPKGPERSTVPPIGAPMPELPGAASMNTGAPKSSSGLPPVRTWPAKPVRLQPDDTNFQALSKRLYGSEKYAAALLAYNRAHPLASDAIKQNPPRLSSDLPIYAPPAEVLSAKYASLLPEAAMPPVTVGRPMPLGGGLRPAPAPPTADAVQRYTVPPQGQLILEVARQTLGDGNRWPEIYRLNPALQPQNPIPGGTQLRIPTGRRGP